MFFFGPIKAKGENKNDEIETETIADYDLVMVRPAFRQTAQSFPKLITVEHYWPLNDNIKILESLWNQSSSFSKAQKRLSPLNIMWVINSSVKYKKVNMTS